MRARTENDSRRVKLLEQKITEAKEAITAVAKSGGITPETLAQIEKSLKLL